MPGVDSRMGKKSFPFRGVDVQYCGCSGTGKASLSRGSSKA